MYKHLKKFGGFFVISALIFSSCTNPAKENTLNTKLKPVPNSSANPNQTFNFDKFDPSKVKTDDTFKVQMDSESNIVEMQTDYHWLWVDAQGVEHQSRVVNALKSYIRIPPDINDNVPDPIWSEIYDYRDPYPGTAKCGDCTVTFNRGFGLIDKSDILSMNVMVQADDSLKVFVNNTFIQQVNYNEVKTVNIPLNLLKNGFNVLSLQGYNGAVVSPWEAYNYAGVAAKVIFEMKPDTYISPCGNYDSAKSIKTDIKLRYANFKTKVAGFPNPCEEETNENNGTEFCETLYDSSGNPSQNCVSCNENQELTFEGGRPKCIMKNEPEYTTEGFNLKYTPYGSNGINQAVLFKGECN